MGNLLKNIHELGDNHQTIKGAFFMALGFFCYATISALFKSVEQEYSMLQVVFFRSLFALVPYSVALHMTGRWDALNNPPLIQHILRAIVGVIGLSCLFRSLSLLPLADATVLTFTISLFMVLLSMPLLRERISTRNFLAIIVGFLGVIIVSNPTGGGNIIGYASGLCFGLFEAFVILKGRMMTRTNSNGAIVFYYALLSAVICGVFLPFVWVTPTLKDWLILIILGLGGGLGQYLVTIASRYAHAGVLGPMTYTMMLWSLMYGYFLFEEVPQFNVWLGGTFVILSGLYVVNYERKSSQRA